MDAGDLSRNIPLIYITGFLRGLVFFLPILALYLEQQVVSVAEVTLILAIGSVTAMVFEIPSGALSDMFGRKNTLLLAGALLVLAVLILGIGGTFWILAIYAVLNGLAESLFSGTDSSLAYDSLKQAGQEKKFKRFIAINGALWPVGASISSLVGGFLAGSSLQLPIWATLIPFALALGITFLLEEPRIDSETHDPNVLAHMKSAASTVFKSKMIIILMLASLLFYAFGEVAHQLKPIFFEFKNLPVESFGIIFAATFALSAAGSLSAEKVSDKIGDKSTLILSAVVPSILIFGATLVTGLWVAILIVASSVFWGLRGPVISHLINSVIPSRQRTTILSMGNLANRLGFAAFAPVFGLLTDITSINITYQATAVLSLIPAVLLYFLVIETKMPQ